MYQGVLRLSTPLYTIHLCLCTCAVITEITASSTIHAGLHLVFTAPRVSIKSLVPSSVSVSKASTATDASSSTAVPRRPARTALPAATRPTPEVTSAHAQRATSVRRATSTTHAAPVVLAPSVSVMAARVPQHPVPDASSCTSVLVCRGSTDRIAHSSTRVPPRRVSMALLASRCPECSIRARARKDSTASTANGAHLVKIVRAGTAPRVWKPEERSAAHVQPDTSATRVTKATLVSWRRVRSAGMAEHAGILPIFSIPASVCPGTMA